MEVSVCLAGIPLRNGFFGACDKVAWKLVWGLQELPAAAQDSQDWAGQGVEGLLALAGRLPRLCIHQGVSHAAEEGIQFLPLVRFLSFSLEGLWRVREVLFLSFSLEGCWSKYPAAGLERPVYIGLEIY